jgi:hypothetical protein
MGMVAGNGGHPQDAVGLIDTRIYGNPEEIREAAAVIEKLHNTFYDAFIEMMNSLVPMPEYWAGKSADAYEEALFDFRLKTEDNSDFAYRSWEAMRAYAQQLDYHYRDMETIRNDARACGLDVINEYDIAAPPLLGQEPPMPASNASMQEQDQYRADIYEYEQHKQRLRDFAELRERARLVRYDLEQWVIKHLQSVQANAPEPFMKEEQAGTVDKLKTHWTIASMMIETSTKTRQKTRLEELEKANSRFTRVAQDPSMKRVPPLMNQSLSKAMEARKEYRAASNVASTTAKNINRINNLLLAYEVASSDEPSATAVSGVAGIVGGYIGSSLAAEITVTLTAPALVLAGGEVVAAAAAAAGSSYLANVAYKQVPLEYRERIDNTLWHLPYYVGLGW